MATGSRYSSRSAMDYRVCHAIHIDTIIYSVSSGRDGSIMFRVDLIDSIFNKFAEKFVREGLT